MPDDMPEKPAGQHAAPVHDSSHGLGRIERLVAAAIGTLAATAGAIAVFISQNGIGATALLGIGTLFLLASIFALVPTRLRVGEQEVEFQRAAAGTVRRLLIEAEPEVKEEVRQTLDEKTVKAQDRHNSHEDVLERLTRGESASCAPELYAELTHRGWQPHPAPARNYFRWIYSGRRGSATVYQDSRRLVIAAKALRPFAATLPDTSFNAKGEVLMPYTDLQQALHSLERMREHVDGQAA